MTKLLAKQSWFLQKIHISWQIAILSVGFLLGVAMAGNVNANFTGNEWLIPVGILVLLAGISRTHYMLLVMLLAGSILGLWRGGVEQQALSSYSTYFDQKVTVSGVVAEDTSYGTTGDQRFKLKEVSINHQQIAGTVWVSTTKEMDIKRGDNLQASGLLKEGFGTISASMYRANILEIKRPIPGDVGRRLRDWFAEGVTRSMPAQEANLALAFLVGQKLNVSETLNDQLRTVGLIHAVVASGYHLTVLIGVVRRLFVRVSKYLTFIFSAGMISGFIMITGFSPSMNRAGIVSSLSLVAWYYGRIIHPLVLLPFAAAITVMYQPEYIWGDVGWYLSFTAFTGVLTLTPLLNDYFWGSNQQPTVVREILLSTVAAQLLTMPIVIFVFGYYSAYALLANLLVVPLIPLTMLLTFVSGIIGLTLPVIASVCGLPLVWILTYMTKVIEWISRLPSAKTELEINVLGVAVSYVLIILFTAFLWRQTRHDFRSSNHEQKLL